MAPLITFMAVKYLFILIDVKMSWSGVTERAYVERVFAILKSKAPAFFIQILFNPDCHQILPRLLAVPQRPGFSEVRPGRTSLIESIKKVTASNCEESAAS